MRTCCLGSIGYFMMTYSPWMSERKLNRGQIDITCYRCIWHNLLAITGRHAAENLCMLPTLAFLRRVTVLNFHTVCIYNFPSHELQMSNNNKSLWVYWIYHAKSKIIKVYWISYFWQHMSFDKEQISEAIAIQKVRWFVSNTVYHSPTDWFALCKLSKPW